MASPRKKILPPYCTQMLPRGGSYPKNGEEILRSSRRSRHEFIARDFRRNAHSAVLGGLDPHNLTLAANIYITRLRDLLRKSDHEFNFAANFKIGISDEVQPAVTDVPRVRVQFSSFCRPRQNPHGKTHRESPRFAAVRSFTHQYPLGLWNL